MTNPTEPGFLTHPLEIPLTPSEVSAGVTKAEYYRKSPLVTVVTLTLAEGLTVEGISTAASVEAYDKDAEITLAREKALVDIPE